MAAIIVFGLVAVACSPGSAEPGDQLPAGLPPDVTHVLEPTDQMRQAAEQQCLEDPGLAEGYVRAVTPDTDEVLAEITVQCSEVRDS